MSNPLDNQHDLFSAIDFVIFSVMLCFSILIGIYYGFWVKSKNDTNEYLLGGKSMKGFPVALSVIASHVSGIALLSMPVDIYTFGTSYFWTFISIIISYFGCCYVFLPVFLKMGVFSICEYLNIRFNKKIRTLASFIYTLSMFLYNPIVIYVPALAFSQATGLNIYFITPVVSLVCIFYTTIGGLKAVIWADVVQTVAMICSMIAIFVLGLISVGGFGVIWNKSLEGHRLDVLDFKLDLTKRDGFWAIVIGNTAATIQSFALSQGTVQRLMSVPTAAHSRKVALISCLGIAIISESNVLTGMMLYAKYATCDPLLAHEITRNDQLLTHFTMQVAGNVLGLPGLFIAGIFGAALSTLSTTLNTMSGIIYQDFISPFVPANTTEKRANNVLKSIVVVVGTISTLLVFVVDHLGGVLPLIYSFGGLTTGPLLGLFSLGMLFPIANSKGALSGGIAGLLFSSVMVFGNQYYNQKGLLGDVSKPLSVDGCINNINITIPVYTVPLSQPFILYRITFWYYPLLGALVVIIVGLLVSWFTKKVSHDVNPDLISPVMHFLLNKNKPNLHQEIDYYGVDKALVKSTLQ